MGGMYSSTTTRLTAIATNEAAKNRKNLSSVLFQNRTKNSAAITSPMITAPSRTCVNGVITSFSLQDQAGQQHEQTRQSHDVPIDRQVDIGVQDLVHDKKD